MAASDYRLCDGCGRKAFYDAQLNFHLHREAPEHELRYAGKGGTYMTLDYCGDWAVLCTDCAQTHRCIVVPLTRGEEAGG